MLVNQGVQLALAHYGIGKVETVELNLAWTVVLQVVVAAVFLFEEVDELVVQRAMGNKLKCTDGVGNALKVVALTMSKVIHGVAIPLGASAVVGSMDYAIHNGVSEVHIGIGHVKFGTQYHAAFSGFGRIHELEQTKVFLYGTVAIWAGDTWGCRSAFLLGNLLRGLLVNVCQAFLYHPNSKFPQLLKIVGSVIDVAPMET